MIAPDHEISTNATLMKTFSLIKEMTAYSRAARESGKTLGFVPTMGALHPGHIELVKRAVAENDLTIVSIFVNPIQFNNPDDLKKYPRTLEKDLEMLSTAGCDVVFIPEAAEMYPEPENTVYDFGKLDKVMEGLFRPGHFNGVAIVVRKFLEITLPHKAYFGEKDFQQLAIIKQLVKMLALPAEIIPCPIVREPDGLAMSSRNVRLTEEQRAAAPEIHASLDRIRETYHWFTPEGLGKMIIGDIEQNPLIRVEYSEVADAETLMPFNDWEDAEHAVLCIAAFLGEVRLIDNVVLY